jgi:hypothetical protein
MTLPFTPFEPVVWLIFAAFLLGTVIIVKLFHRRYPNYPQDAEEGAKSNYSKRMIAEKKAGTPVE